MAAWDEVRAFALALPYAVENFPWGESVLKIDYPPGRLGRDGLEAGPMFVWLGRREAAAISVKLVASYDEAVSKGNARPTSMSGLGRWGWLTIPLHAEFDLLYDWVEESYRTVAPRKLIAEWDRSGHE